MADESNTKTEVYLEADKEIPGQHYVCLSFISPQKTLEKKDIYFFSEFLKDYEIQYKVRATETFVMSEVAKLQEAASKVQDVLENFKLNASDIKPETIEEALTTVRDMRAKITRDVATDLESHVKSEMADFKTSTLKEAYETFVYKNKKKLEEDFFELNSFRTTVQGLKIRGVYDTYGEATHRAKALQKIDPSFNVYVGQVGRWLPWDPEPHEVQEQEYAEDQLNSLMKKYKENESQRDEFFAQTKQEKLKGAKVSSAVFGSSQNEQSVSNAAAMFGGEDLAIARKKEAASVESNINA
jgi:hypothetical protein